MKSYIKGMILFNSNTPVLRRIITMHKKGTYDLYFSTTTKDPETALNYHKTKAQQGNRGETYDRMRELGTQDWEVNEIDKKVCTKQEANELVEYWAERLDGCEHLTSNIRN